MKQREQARDWLLTSLQIGDHRTPYRSTLWALTAFAWAIPAALFRRRKRPLAGPGPLLYVSSPVGHGRIFSTAVAQSLTGVAVVWRDARLDDGIDAPPSDFPSIAPRSVAAFLRPRHLRYLFAPGPTRDPDAPRLYWRYLAFAQRTRRAIAEESFRTATPSIVLTDFDRNSGCAPLVFAARGLGIPTATLVHASPSSTYVPVVAEHVLTWSSHQSRWFKDAQPGLSTHLIGRPDLAGAAAPVPAGGPRRLVIAHSCEQLTKPETDALVELATLARERGLSPVVRSHPILRGKEPDGLWRDVVAACDGFDTTGRDWLASSDAVVVVTSSAAIDALAAGRAAAVVADPARELPCELAILARSVPTANDVLAITGEEVQRLRQAILPLVGEPARATFREVVRGLEQRQRSDAVLAEPRSRVASTRQEPGHRGR